MIKKPENMRNIKLQKIPCFCLFLLVTISEIKGSTNDEGIGKKSFS